MRVPRQSRGFTDCNYWPLTAPTEISADVSKTESGDKIVYDEKVTEAMLGPNHRRVVVDKTTGEVDYQEYWLGIIRKPV